MNTLIKISIERPFLQSALLLITLVLTCFALAPGAQAVTPAPDGGYPGGNTAEGQNALLSLTNGTYNTAVGTFSLESNTEGNFNTAIGAATLLVNEIRKHSWAEKQARCDQRFPETDSE